MSKLLFGSVCGHAPFLDTPKSYIVAYIRIIYTGHYIILCHIFQGRPRFVTVIPPSSRHTHSSYGSPLYPHYTPTIFSRPNPNFLRKHPRVTPSTCRMSGVCGTWKLGATAWRVWVGCRIKDGNISQSSNECIEHIHS